MSDDTTDAIPAETTSAETTPAETTPAENAAGGERPGDAHQDAVEALTTALHDLDEVLGTLRGQLATTVGRWDSTSRDTYEQVQRGWSSALATMQAIIDAFNARG